MVDRTAALTRYTPWAGGKLPRWCAALSHAPYLSRPWSLRLDNAGYAKH
ncbi:MAG: hypothetical protein ABI167_11180 [Nitrosospira sp.]